MNASVLDRNIVHAFEWEKHPALLEHFYWRFRNNLGEIESEQRAFLAYTCALLINIATPDWRIRIELHDFFAERIRYG